MYDRIGGRVYEGKCVVVDCDVPTWHSDSVLTRCSDCRDRERLAETVKDVRARLKLEEDRDLYLSEDIRRLLDIAVLELRKRRREFKKRINTKTGVANGKDLG